MKTTSWIIIIILVLLFGIGTYFIMHGNKNTISNNTSTNPSTNTNPSVTPIHSNIMGKISNNHGHSVVLTAAEQDAEQAVSLELTPGAGHTHTLSLSANQVRAASDGTMVEITSSVDAGHSHVVTFN